MKILLKSAFMALGLLPLFCAAQINSPYSRYGIGNTTPMAHIANRGMGGISIGVSDPTWLNPINPASYSSLNFTTLDLGLQFSAYNLKSKDPIANFKSNNALFNYIAIGFPILNQNKKAVQSKTSWTFALGLRPITRINYKINDIQSATVGDSISYIYEGNGGMNEVFIGTALKLKNFSLGFNTGYLFGEKNYSTRMAILDDSVSHSRANFENQSRFGGLFLTTGLQYSIPLKKGRFTLGAYSRLKRTYSGNRDELSETFTYGPNGEINNLDTVHYAEDIKGKVMIPATYGIGFSLEKPHFLFGVDYETTQWSKYRFFGTPDFTRDSWEARAGFQYLPASPGTTGYFNFVRYRAGFSFGTDYINVDGDLPYYTISIGGGFPLRLSRSFYNNQYSTLNLTLEYGSRGNKENNITESFYKISLGLSLGDVWFLRQKYQ